MFDDTQRAFALVGSGRAGTAIAPPCSRPRRGSASDHSGSTSRSASPTTPTATVASNHLVALMGQVARLAEAAGVPSAALLPLVRSTLDDVDACGPANALTGPIVRGDIDTVARHLDALPADKRRTYRALAEQALRLSGRDDPALRDLVQEPTP